MLDFFLVLHETPSSPLPTSQWLQKAKLYRPHCRLPSLGPGPGRDERDSEGAKFRETLAPGAVQRSQAPILHGPESEGFLSVDPLMPHLPCPSPSPARARSFQVHSAHGDSWQVERGRTGKSYHLSPGPILWGHLGTAVASDKSALHPWWYVLHHFVSFHLSPGARGGDSSLLLAQMTALSYVVPPPQHICKSSLCK